MNALSKIKKGGGRGAGQAIHGRGAEKEERRERDSGGPGGSTSGHGSAGEASGCASKARERQDTFLWTLAPDMMGKKRISVPVSGSELTAELD